MRKRPPHLPSIICAICAICGSNSFSAVKTNVVFILTDNHGAWTLGCYGNPDIKTPHIDKLAAEGVRFSRAFCNNAVCSPTRATYLTGLMPSQHGVHNFLSGGRLQTGPEARNSLEEFTSLPEILKAEGYKCGLVGKWHLGANESPQEGLDDYWITMPHGGTSTFHGARVIENGETRVEPTYLTDLWTEHACKFIDSNKDGPFFLYLAFNGPYGLSRYQLESSGNRHAAYYADKPMHSFPRGAIHPWQQSNREYFGNLTSMRRYGEELSAVDDGVGAVMQKLEDCGIAGDTLVIFAADQGWAGGQHGLWGMGDHTRPVNAREFSMHIPMIFRHRADRAQSAPGIPGGRVSDIMVSNYDFLPSVLGYLGLEARKPTEPKLPGRDFSAVLQGEAVPDWEDEVYYEYEGLRCVRTEDWKYVERRGEEHEELYHLVEDPGERRNLAGDEALADRQAALKEKVDAFFAEHALAKYDLWNGGGSQTRLFWFDEESKQRHIDRAKEGRGPIPQVMDPEVDVPPMTLPEGLVAEVAAAPPLTRHPMMANFDDRGRLFVAEAAGVNRKAEELDAEKPNFIRLLEDTNGDGLFDKSKIFADKLTFPSGALWHDGALWVTAAPSIWRLEDTDDDGVADVRQEIVTGFGYTGNAADLHGPFLHPNGRIFWVHGRKDLDVHDRDGNLIHKGKGARIWSCAPDGGDVQIYAGGGMDNPVEIDFTPEGEIVGSVNLMYGRPRGDTLVHWQYGGAYPRYDQEAVLEEFTRTGDLLPEFYNFGHVAISGMTRYRHSITDGAVPGFKRAALFNDQWLIFTSHFNTHKITRTTVEAAGGTFSHARTEDFLVIDDPDSHLTDVLEDADGTLLVIDTGGWFRNGCPTSQIAKPEIPGAIYRVRNAGLVDFKDDPRGLQIDWGQAAFEELAGLLDDARFAVRDRAILELAARGDASVPALNKALGSQSVGARRNAVWAATRIGSDAANAVIRRALGDAHPSLRHTACNGIWKTRDREAVAPLIKLLLEDESPAVQMAAARALGRIGDRAAVDALLQYAERSYDRVRDHAAIYALIEIDDYEGTARGLRSASADVQRRVLWALDGMESSKLAAGDVLPFFDSASAELSAAAVEVSKRRPDWAGGIAAEFQGWLDEGGLSERRRVILPELASLHLEHKAMQALVARFVGAAGQKKRGTGFEIIAGSPKKIPLFQQWERGIASALDSEEETLLRGALAALEKVDTDRFDEQLRTIADDDSRPSLVRIDALAAVSKGSGAISQAALDLLRGLLAPGAAGSQRLEAAAMLSGARLTMKQRMQVAPLLKTAGPMELPLLINVFDRMRDAELGIAMVQALEESEVLAALSPSEFRRTLTRFPPEVYDRAKPLVERLEKEFENREARLAELAPRLVRGSAARGKEVFAAGKGACMTCHKIGDVGREVGPDLNRVGRIRTKRDLLESILYPSTTLSRDFEPWEIIADDGQTHFGIIRRETADTLFLVDAAAEEKPVPRDSIKEIRPGRMSLMPMGLDQTMTPEELIDLVAFLDSLE